MLPVSKKERATMKKILYIIILTTAIVFLFINIKAKIQEDALQFKVEYEELNGEITKFKTGTSVSQDTEEENTLLQEYVEIMK